ncbi:MAG TPA: DUF6192 family protein [Kineosporiaceae bacterium]|nr:DUF6192 family protein [Kineosporiaceae bacterium]
MHTETVKPDPVHPIPPTPDHPDRALQFLDLTTACHRFTTSIRQVLPRLHSQQLSADQLTAVQTDIARARVALDLLETATDTCEIDVDEALIHLLESR